MERRPETDVAETLRAAYAAGKASERHFDGPGPGTERTAEPEQRPAGADFARTGADEGWHH